MDATTPTRMQFSPCGLQPHGSAGTSPGAAGPSSLASMFTSPPGLTDAAFQAAAVAQASSSKPPSAPPSSSRAPRSGGGQLLETAGKRRSCNCRNSRCLKLYCECFASASYCFATCNCQGCFNNTENDDKRRRAIEQTLER